ncbi:hypothetical protein E2C01_088115 [Portunus trituberculatus]|uniref:Uncharacterized protein n=1 Tax=Portunus trituberculatus TaxID=210409 RepID=A0A5B7J8C4_PORTR|nr:hypothetical protein [Portunus trituberculatus]
MDSEHIQGAVRNGARLDGAERGARGDYRQGL